jgi:protein-disulfide isomerase-like protein with CxxC motif
MIGQILKKHDAAIIEGSLEALAAEREACAALCERMGAEGFGTLAIAAAIRSRSK